MLYKTTTALEKTNIPKQPTPLSKLRHKKSNSQNTSLNGQINATVYDSIGKADSNDCDLTTVAALLREHLQNRFRVTIPDNVMILITDYFYKLSTLLIKDTLQCYQHQKRLLVERQDVEDAANRHGYQMEPTDTELTPCPIDSTASSHHRVTDKVGFTDDLALSTSHLSVNVRLTCLIVNPACFKALVKHILTDFSKNQTGNKRKRKYSSALSTKSANQISPGRPNLDIDARAVWSDEALELLQSIVEQHVLFYAAGKLTLINWYSCISRSCRSSSSSVFGIGRMSVYVYFTIMSCHASSKSFASLALCRRIHQTNHYGQRSRLHPLKPFIII